MIQFTYMPDWRWLLGGGVVLAAILFASYYFAKSRPRMPLQIFLLCLRWIAIAVVIFCLLDPQWIEAIKHQRKTRVAVLLDTSRSMGIKDVPGGRLAAAKDWLHHKFAPATPPSVAVSYYTFNQTLAPMPDLDSAKPAGDVTALADAMENLLSVPNDDPLAGVVLLSDGIENTHKAPEAAAKLYRRKGIPIHTVLAGTTNDMRDIIVENVQVKRAVPNEAPTRLELTVRSPGYRNQAVAVQVRHDKEVVAVQQVKLTGGSQKIQMEFTPRQKGFQTFEVTVPAQNGEWLTTNNRRLFGLEVIDPTIRVIYMEGTPQQAGSPMPEWKYLKDALQSDPNIKVKTLYRQFGAKGQHLNTIDVDPDTRERIYPVEHASKGFPRTLADLLEYDVVIHSDIRKESFTPEQLQNIARLVEAHGGGFVMIGGNSAFGKGGYHRTILDRIIPVAMEQANDSQARPFKLRVPPPVLAHPIMAIGANRQETELIWGQKFPWLHGCNRVDRAKPGALVLGEDPEYHNGVGNGLILAVQEIGKGRSMAFTSDTTRTWGRDFEVLWGEPINRSLPLSEENCDSRYYRQFWVNAVRWLAAGKVGRTNSAVSLELSQSYCLPGDAVSASVKVRNTELKEISTADVSLWLSVGGKTNQTVKAKYDGISRAYVAEMRSSAAGNLVVTAAATLKGAKLGDDRQLLVCEAADREMAELRAQPGLMASIARDSGGKSFSLADTEASDLKSIFGNVPPATVEYRRTPLWDKPWWLGLILGLLTVEWALRRMKGMA